MMQVRNPGVPRTLRTMAQTLAILTTTTLMLGQGCPPQDNSQNTAPNANAGNNQTVGFGETVNLDGNSSSDADGDTLSFAWVQSAGTNVNLSGANTATPSFTSPNAEDILTFELTVNDGNGGTDTDSVNVTVTQNGNNNNVDPTLYIANFSGNNVVAYDISNPNNVNGNIAPDANLQGAQTLLVQPSDIIIDAGGALLASNFGTPSVTGYDNADVLTGINGNVAPSRNVQGAATLLNGPTSLAANTVNDLAFVADNGTDQIYVYANASTNAFNGNLAPTRTIASVDINDPFGINFGGNDVLYVANNGNNTVAAFANASNLNGNVNATRIIQSGFFTNLFDVFIDDSDTMFVVDANGSIFTFNNASTLNGNVNPDFTLTVPPAVGLTAIAVDSGGTGYIVDSVNDAVYSYDNIATLNGAVNPTRTLQGANTQLNAPIRVFLIE